MSAPSASIHIALRGLRKSYGEILAVDGLDLQVERGELLVLVGPSGCGKTTVLRLVAGLEEPTAGAVELGGKKAARLLPGERDVAMVFQSFALFPHLSVRENLSFEIRFALRAGEVARRVEEAARVLGLEDVLDRFPGEIASGQKQRVALGRAVIRQAQILLLDEPLSSLDAGLRSSMRSEILRLHRARRPTTLYVTHDQAEARFLGERLAVLRAGRLEQVGTPEEVYRYPRTTFVAGFLGEPSMNLLRAQVLDECGRSFVRLAGARVEIPPLARASLSPGREIIAGIRPEAVRVVSPGSGRLRGKVEAVERLGRERLLLVLPQGVDRSASIKVLASAADPPVEACAEVDLSLEGSDLHLFDPETGRALLDPEGLSS